MVATLQRGPWRGWTNKKKIFEIYILKYNLSRAIAIPRLVLVDVWRCCTKANSMQFWLAWLTTELHSILHSWHLLSLGISLKIVASKRKGKVEGGAKKVCSVNDCLNTVNGNGLCKNHGGGKPKPCTVEGCATAANSRGLCRKHTKQTYFLPKICSVDDCSNNVDAKNNQKYAKGLCRTHRPMTPCAFEGCATSVAARGLSRGLYSGATYVYT